MFVMNVTGLRRASDSVTADVCCKVVLNARFSYNSMALVAEMSAFIIYAVNVMKNALREGLLRPECSLRNNFTFSTRSIVGYGTLSEGLIA